ncbi:MAG: hypothetical protein A3J48_00415 [Candidatus Doudnabacteria bacterium RIFCSPHIGHO2_02_FULL_46_11]|uniref:Metallo-beta-lactamase domain-containing protein n=1 Tax=Candidatus Doudnabacteria bacterium RIFCSPHIGHO2_02_FULL_46_11 TaxID=1817832 RepID=A0A1F5P4V5_9BACT|nr:MAG: hypothetical protein A3J48_00415 [Candidatus Doudnabacteria bacterium RIFCSPHIGHO2_02_FULL_46_11]
MALPVIAPWLKTAEAINYAKAIKPKKAFPVHDSFLKFPGVFHKLPDNFLSAAGIDFFVPVLGEEFEV